MATAGANPFALEGQTILIAGGASGIGASAAAACAALGAKLILADIADASPVADKLRSEGHAASTATCDVTDRGAVERLVADAGAIDAMIVCSGICPFDDWMDEDWDEVYERTNAVNVKGTVNCVRAALPPMMERGAAASFWSDRLPAAAAGFCPARIMWHRKARLARWCAGSRASARHAMFWSTASRRARSTPA